MKEKLEILNEYIKSGLSPLLIENIPISIFDDAVVLEAKNAELNGHYENMEFVAPDWYNELIKKHQKILILNNIDELDQEKQTKFIEILKYKKISTFELPKDCIIIVSVSNLKIRKINEEVYSLLIHI